MILAMAVHAGPFRDFVCSTCRAGPGPDGKRRDLNQGLQWAAAVLAPQRYRFCECCRTRLDPFEPHRLGSFWVCPSCTGGAGGDPDAIAVLCRRRYLDLTRHPDEDLRAFDMAMEAMRLDMEEVTAPPEEQGRLRAERRARAEEALRRLGEVHGAEPRREGGGLPPGARERREHS